MNDLSLEHQINFNWFISWDFLKFCKSMTRCTHGLTIQKDPLFYRLVLQHGDNPEHVLPMPMSRVLNEPQQVENEWIQWIEEIHRRRGQL